MRYIPTPWREEYVKNVFKMRKCIFCLALRKKNEKKAYILFKGKHNFIMLNKYPYTPGHLMIAPYEHLASIEEANKEITDEMTDLVKMSLKILRKKYKPQGFNMGMNLGQSAGAGVTDHYHLHIIPRWSGDANFMPIVSKTRVIIESLERTFEKLYAPFQKMKIATQNESIKKKIGQAKGRKNEL